MSVDKKIAHELLVIPREGIVPAEVFIPRGKIVGTRSGLETVEASEVIDVGGKQVFPGVIDSHTHYGLGSGDDEVPEREDENWLKNVRLKLDRETGDFIVSHRSIEELW
jgi:imidazolonepropionase-like amidohydrolase